MKNSIDVALILWNTDIIDLLSLVLLRTNLISCGCEPSEGTDRIEDLILSCGPSVVLFDLSPPYEQSAAVVQHLFYRFPDRSFVITCANSALALKNAPWLSGYTMFQKPYDIDEVANDVRSLVQRSSILVNCSS